MFLYKNQTGISWGLLFLCVALSVVLSQPSLAQGVFIVTSNPTEVAETNLSALAGSLIFRRGGWNYGFRKDCCRLWHSH